MRTTLFAVSSILALAVAACGDDGNGGVTGDARPTTDATVVDAPEIDADIDAAIDAAVDAPIDAVIDAPIDAVVDAPIDAPVGLAGDLCSNAEPVVLVGGAATITATTASPYMNNYRPGVCAQVNSNGPDRVHSITIPNGQRLTATVDPTSGTYDPGIFLIAGPASNCDASPIACLAANDSGANGQNDTITFDNTTGQDIDVLIIIDGYRLEGDAYTLFVTVSLP